MKVAYGNTRRSRLISMGFRGSRVQIPPSRFCKRLIYIRLMRTPSEMIAGRLVCRQHTGSHSLLGVGALHTAWRGIMNRIVGEPRTRYVTTYVAAHEYPHEAPRPRSRTSRAGGRPRRGVRLGGASGEPSR